MQFDTAAQMRGAGLGALASGAAAMTVTSIACAAAPAKANAPAPAISNAPQPLQAKFKRKNVLYGGKVPVAGVLLTRQGGRRILLQVNKGRGWNTVARTRNGPRGRFSTRFR